MSLHRVTIHGENIAGSAITNVGNSIRTALIAHGLEVAMDYDFKNLNGFVINLLPHHITRIEGAKRFTGINKIVNVFAPNVEEYSPSEMASIALSALKHPMVCPSDYAHRSFMDFVVKYFSPEIIMKLGKNIHTIPYGINPQFSGKFNPANADRFIVPFVRDNQGQKRIKLHHDISKTIAKDVKNAFSRDISTTFLYNPVFLKKESLYPSYEMKEVFESQVLLSLDVRDYGFFISTSQFESFGLFYLELLASGVVGIFADKPWVRSLLPHDYPFIYPDKLLGKKALEVYAQVINGDCDEAKKAILSAQSHIRTMYSWDTFASAVSAL